MAKFRDIGDEERQEIGQAINERKLKIKERNEEMKKVLKKGTVRNKGRTNKIKLMARIERT